MLSDFSEVSLKAELLQLCRSTLISLLPVSVQAGIYTERFFGSEFLLPKGRNFNMWEQMQQCTKSRK